MIRSLIYIALSASLVTSCTKKTEPPKAAGPVSPKPVVAEAKPPAPDSGAPIDPAAGEPVVAVDPEKPAVAVDPEEPVAVVPEEPVAVVPEEPVAVVPEQPAGDPVEPSAPAAPSAAADPGVCAALVAKEFELVRASGTEEMRKSYDAADPAEATARCQKHRILQSVVDCSMNATTALELYRTCVPLAFVGRDLTVGRVFQGGADNSGAEPDVFALDGDTVEFGRCKMIHQQVEQYRGFFVSCDGKTVGPITTGEDITVAMDELSKDSAAGHSAVMGIINNYPRGGSGRWRVCDASGNCRIE